MHVVASPFTTHSYRFVLYHFSAMRPTHRIMSISRRTTKASPPRIDLLNLSLSSKLTPLIPALYKGEGERDETYTAPPHLSIHPPPPHSNPISLSNFSRLVLLCFCFLVCYYHYALLVVLFSSIILRTSIYLFNKLFFLSLYLLIFFLSCLPYAL